MHSDHGNGFCVNNHASKDLSFFVGILVVDYTFSIVVMNKKKVNSGTLSLNSAAAMSDL